MNYDPRPGINSTLERKDAEIERLRAALDMIMRDGQRGRGLAVRLADTARAALNHQQNAGEPK